MFSLVLRVLVLTNVHAYFKHGYFKKKTCSPFLPNTSTSKGNGYHRVRWWFAYDQNALCLQKNLYVQCILLEISTLYFCYLIFIQTNQKIVIIKEKWRRTRRGKKAILTAISLFIYTPTMCIVCVRTYFNQNNSVMKSCRLHL